MASTLPNAPKSCSPLLRHSQSSTDPCSIIPKKQKNIFYHLHDSNSKEEIYDDNDHKSDDDDGDNPGGVRQNKDVPSFLEALKILAHPNYHLVDAYPTLCKVYAIAVAIPISSATAERSFSALKRVKTRIRSTMLQGRLEALLLMAVERQILHSLDKQYIINRYLHWQLQQFILSSFFYHGVVYTMKLNLS